ncbi:MAG: hypothetical protein GYB31_08845 [Bacteroidetes bacterium]|nr:hypothetical protein [Bacteroidota bacterium]
MKRSLTIIFSLLCFYAFGQINQADGDPVYLNGFNTLQEAVDFRTDVLEAPAGDAVEGDFFAQPVYTRDGSLILLPNRGTNNITVFNALSFEIEGTIEGCDTPMDLAVSDDYAVVPCFGSATANIYSLDGLSLVATIETDPEPAKAAVSPDGSLAMIGTQSGGGTLVDLTTFESTYIADFQCFLGKFSFITSNTRNTVSWSDFGFAPDNSYLINGVGDAGAKIYDTETGDLINTIAEVPASPHIRLSGDGSTWILMGIGTDAQISRIDAATATLIDQIPLTGYSVWSIYGGPSVNMAGDRVLVPIYPDNLALVRFDEGDFTTIPIGTTPNWLGQSADYQYGVVGSYYLSVVDMESGAVSSQLTGRPIQNGTVSPTENKFIGFDPLRLESVHFFDFANPDALEYVDTRPSGSPLEADATYSVKIIDDNRALAMNPLSGSMSVFDYQTQELIALIPMGSHETYEAALTSDGNWAVVPRRLENDVVIVDLNTYEIVAEVPGGGEKPDQAFVLPGDQYAYVMNAGGTDRIGVIALDGANSSYESNFVIGNTGISWTNYGLRSELVFTPDGQYGVLAASFVDEVQIIDLETHSIINELPIEGFPLQLAVGEIPGLGTAIGVTLRNAGQIAVVTDPGPAASITEGLDVGDSPVDISYGLADDGSEQPGFYVSCAGDNSVHFFSLDAFEVTYTKEYGPDHTPLSVENSEYAGAFTLLSAVNSDLLPYLELPSGEALEFTGRTRPIIHLQEPVPGVAMVPDISNDRVLVFFTDIVGSQVKSVDLSGKVHYEVFPQPSGEWIHFRQEALSGAGYVRIYSPQGRIVRVQEIGDLSQFSIQLSDQPANTYFYQIGTDQGIIATGSLLLSK